MNLKNKSFLNFEDLELYLHEYEIQKFPCRVPFELDLMREIAEKIGNPHKNVKSIHIAGSKGKGSISYILDSVLTSLGYRVGRFISPHILDIKERISVDGRLAAEKLWCKALEAIYPYLEMMRLDGRPATLFEVYTLLALYIFNQANLDFAVFEVGLGGRLDATNIIFPEVSIINSIELEHTNILGNTLEAIAREKAGIIKGNTPLVLGRITGTPFQTIQNKARELLAPINCFDQDFEVTEISSQSEDCSVFSLRIHSRFLSSLSIRLLGRHQIDNVAVALCAISILEEKGLIEFKEEKIQEGLDNLRLSGRVEIKRRKPWFVFDGAHTVESAKALLKAIKEHIPYRRIIFILGIASDKDHKGILNVLLAHADYVLFTSSGTARSTSPGQLIKIANESGYTLCEVEEDPHEACSKALSMANEDDCVVLTGSFTLGKYSLTSQGYNS